MAIWGNVVYFDVPQQSFEENRSPDWLVIDGVGMIVKQTDDGAVSLQKLYLKAFDEKI